MFPQEIGTSWQTEFFYGHKILLNIRSRKPKGRPKARWNDEVANDIRQMGIVTRKQAARDRDGWRIATT
jgi:hypothetical protein